MNRDKEKGLGWNRAEFGITDGATERTFASAAPLNGHLT